MKRIYFYEWLIFVVLFLSVAFLQNVEWFTIYYKIGYGVICGTATTLLDCVLRNYKNRKR
jgi:hypothetical protein